MGPGSARVVCAHSVSVQMDAWVRCDSRAVWRIGIVEQRLNSFAGNGAAWGPCLEEFDSLAVHSVHNETTVYRVDTGRRMFAFFGYALAGSDSLGMMATTDRIQELNLYDTASGRRLAHRMLDQIVVSAHFLAERRELLVSTASQTVYRIDLAKMLAQR